jgi:hypothetical protein
MKLIYFILLIFCSLSSSAYTRFINLHEELKSASVIKKIVIVSYTSRMDSMTFQEPNGYEKVIDKVKYYYLDSPDSIITYQTNNTGMVNNTVYFDLRKKETINDSIPKIKQGYWPNPNDTVLAIFNEFGLLSLFADITKDNQYKFWSPYHNISWNTTFWINKPFIPDSNATWNKQLYIHLQDKAKKESFDFGSQYHVFINRADFWLYLENIK